MAVLDCHSTSKVLVEVIQGKGHKTDLAPLEKTQLQDAENGKDQEKSQQQPDHNGY